MISDFKGFTWGQSDLPGPCVLSASTYSQIIRKSRTHRNEWPHWVLDYSISAGLLCKVGGLHKHWLERNSAIAHLYPPKTPYWERWKPSKQPFKGAFICFTGGDFAGLNDLIPNNRSFAQFNDPAGRLFELLQTAALAGYDFKSIGFWKAEAALFEIIGLLQLSKACDETDKPRSIAPYPLASEISRLSSLVIKYCSENVHRNVSLEELAHQMNVSVSSLSHRFRADTGESPINAHARLRIQRVKDLLMSGWRLKEIVGEMGFSDIYHLSKAFKRLEGIPPSRFLEGKYFKR